MIKMFICTGKKKKVQMVLDFFKDWQQKQKISILATRQKEKRVLFMNYDEMKILYQMRESSLDEIPLKVLKGLDLHQNRSRFDILLEFTTPETEDKMVKVRVLTLCQPFISKGVKIQATLNSNRQNEYRVTHRCSIRLAGPADEAIDLKDRLAVEKLCVPETVSFIF